MSQTQPSAPLRVSTGLSLLLAIVVTDQAFAQTDDPNRLRRSLLLDQAQADDELYAPASGHPFRWRGADGSELQVFGQIQFRYAGVSRRGDTDNYAGGFDQRRTRLNWAAKAPGERVGLKAITQFTLEGEFEVLDTFLTVNLSDRWNLNAGTMLLPFDREFMVGNGSRMANDLALVVDAVGANEGNGRSDGVQLKYQDDHRIWRGMVSDGASGWMSPAITTTPPSADIALTTRYDHLIFGDLKSFEDEAAFDGEGGLKLGFALHAQTGEIDGDNDTFFDDRSNDFRWVADIVFEEPFGTGGAFEGVFSSLAVYGRHQYIEGVDNEERFGVVAQLAKNVDVDTQFFTRYEWATDDDGGADFSQVTFGWTEYFMGHGLKYTSEIMYAFEPVAQQFASAPRAILADTAGRSGQIGIRTQIHFSF